MTHALTIGFLTLMLSVASAPVHVIPMSEAGQQVQSPTHLAGDLSFAENNASPATAKNECDSKMSENECDLKIDRDLDSAIRNKRKGCDFEPTWRPTHLGTATLHVTETNRSAVVIAMDRKHYTLRTDACQGDCSRWRPLVAMGYSASITNQPEYLNPCLDRVFPAKRNVCIGFGKIKEETFRYGVSRTSEFDVCYSIPGN